MGSERRVITVACLWLAALLPGLVGMNLPPSATLFNQAAAWFVWGLTATYGLRLAACSPRQAAAHSAALLAALGLTAVASTLSWALGSLPMGLAWSGAGTLAGAMALALLGAAMPPTPRILVAWFSAWLVAGLASATIGWVQVFAPEWVDGFWISRTLSGGRAMGNMRQPNHLAGLLLWGLVAVPALVALGPLSQSRTRRVAAFLAFAFILAAVMLTGSRTGLVGVLGLAAWGLIDRRLPRFARALLVGAPLLFALAYGLGSLWAAVHAGGQIGVAQRIGQAEITSGRWLVWRDTLAMIAAEPWLGVGFGEYNRAWTLAPVAQRAAEFFDHSHNLPLQVLVELGLPAGALVLGLLTLALLQAARRCAQDDAAQSAGRRALVAMLVLTALHSALEYPLWYAHFLLPTSFAWGLALSQVATTAPIHRPWPMAIGAALVLGAGVMLWDYQRVSRIFSPADHAASLEQRIAEGQRSWFFAHHADYARITSFEDVDPPALGDFSRATHYLLDTRLLVAWARAHERAGDVQRARWIADRLRELKQDTAAPFFAPCEDASVTEKPFQCAPATARFTWRDFK
jgi:O-antigen ligase